MGKFKIIWSNQARLEVKHIYQYLKLKSPQGAKNVKRDLLNSPKTIHYPEQYQVDDINPKYRRIVVRDYKVLYKEADGVIYVVDVFCTKRSPDILKNK